MVQRRGEEERERQVRRDGDAGDPEASDDRDRQDREQVQAGEADRVDVRLQPGDDGADDSDRRRTGDEAYRGLTGTNPRVRPSSTGTNLVKVGAGRDSG
jgi:hypothetical protein